jgi:hypothetical protein
VHFTVVLYYYTWKEVAKSSSSCPCSNPSFFVSYGGKNKLDCFFQASQIFPSSK